MNATVFWVSNSLVGDWIQLPDAQPQHILVAKMMKKMFTGVLNAPVESYPPFPGTEKHLLRAQLARIQHATEIVPAGMYENSEDDPPVLQLAEPKPMDVATLNSAEAWCHFPKCIINDAARCSLHEKPGMDDDEKAAFDAEVEKAKEETGD